MSHTFEHSGHQQVNCCMHHVLTNIGRPLLPCCWGYSLGLFCFNVLQTLGVSVLAFFFITVRLDKLQFISNVCTNKMSKRVPDRIQIRNSDKTSNAFNTCIVVLRPCLVDGVLQRKSALPQGNFNFAMFQGIQNPQEFVEHAGLSPESSHSQL